MPTKSVPSAAQNADALYTSKSVDAQFSELYDTVFDGLLYHYCSADTFLAIVSSKTLRFSDASKMNDGEEIVWAERQIEISLQRLHDRNDVEDDIGIVSKAFIDKVATEYSRCAESSRQFLVCFSNTGDSLSQWRAYADDAAGFSVGFDPECLGLPANLTRVEYDPEKQQRIIMKSIVEMFRLSKTGSYSEAQFESDVLSLYQHSASFKNPAFVDEREIRATHLVLAWPQKSGLLGLEFTGGSVRGRDVKKQDIRFRSRDGFLIPYLDFNFQISNKCAIKEVWAGPRSPNSDQDIEVVMGTLGYGGVSFHRSGSKFRG